MISLDNDAGIPRTYKQLTVTLFLCRVHKNGGGGGGGQKRGGGDLQYDKIFVGIFFFFLGYISQKETENMPKHELSQSYGHHKFT